MRLLIDSNMAKLPRNCHECFAGFWGFCCIAPAETDGRCPDSDRPDWCPVSEYKEPTKFEIKHAISNTDIPKGMNELDYLELMSNIYTALAKLYGEAPVTYSPSKEEQ